MSTALIPAVYLIRSSNVRKPKSFAIFDMLAGLRQVLFPRQTLQTVQCIPISAAVYHANRSLSQATRGAVDATSTPVQNVGVDHGRAAIVVAQELLESLDLIIYSDPSQDAFLVFRDSAQVRINRITKRFRDPINRSMIQFAPTGRRVPFPGSGPSFGVSFLLGLA